MKKCTLCKTTEIENSSWCKACTKIYNQKYREAHKKKLAKMNKKWRKTNRAKFRETQYNYYKSNKGRIVDLHHAAKRRAKDKQIPFDLSTSFIEDLWNKQNGKCALTKIEFQIPQERTGGKASPFAPSIDRINCSLGYTLDNVRLVCVAVNYALNEFGEEVFGQICEAYLLSRK